MEEQKILKTIYTFTFGRNLYTIRLADIKKVTLLQHKFIERENDTEEITKILYIFNVSGDLIDSADKEELPQNETIIEVKAEENDYAPLYKIYENLIEKWDEYQLSIL